MHSTLADQVMARATIKNSSTATRRPAAKAPAPPPARAQKLSVNVTSDVARRLKRLAFEQQLSESSIVEVALQLLFTRGTDTSLGSLLRQHGASLRRRPTD